MKEESTLFNSSDSKDTGRARRVSGRPDSEGLPQNDPWHGDLGDLSSYLEKSLSGMEDRVHFERQGRLSPDTPTDNTTLREALLAVFQYNSMTQIAGAGNSVSNLLNWDQSPINVSGFPDTPSTVTSSSSLGPANNDSRESLFSARRWEGYSKDQLADDTPKGHSADEFFTRLASGSGTPGSYAPNADISSFLDLPAAGSLSIDCGERTSSPRYLPAICFDSLPNLSSILAADSYGPSRSTSQQKGEYQQRDTRLVYDSDEQTSGDFFTDQTTASSLFGLSSAFAPRFFMQPQPPPGFAASSPPPSWSNPTDCQKANGRSVSPVGPTRPPIGSLGPLFDHSCGPSQTVLTAPPGLSRQLPACTLSVHGILTTTTTRSMTSSARPLASSSSSIPSVCNAQTHEPCSLSSSRNRPLVCPSSPVTPVVPRSTYQCLSDGDNSQCSYNSCPSTSSSGSPSDVPIEAAAPPPPPPKFPPPALTRQSSLSCPTPSSPPVDLVKSSLWQDSTMRSALEPQHTTTATTPPLSFVEALTASKSSPGKVSQEQKSRRSTAPSEASVEAKIKSTTVGSSPHGGSRSASTLAFSPVVTKKPRTVTRKPVFEVTLPKAPNKAKTKVINASFVVPPVEPGLSVGRVQPAAVVPSTNPSKKKSSDSVEPVPKSKTHQGSSTEVALWPAESKSSTQWPRISDTLSDNISPRSYQDKEWSSPNSLAIAEQSFGKEDKAAGLNLPLSAVMLRVFYAIVCAIPYAVTALFRDLLLLPSKLILTFCWTTTSNDNGSTSTVTTAITAAFTTTTVMPDPVTGGKVDDGLKGVVNEHLDKVAEAQAVKGGRTSPKYVRNNSCNVVSTKAPKMMGWDDFYQLHFSRAKEAGNISPSGGSTSYSLSKWFQDSLHFPSMDSDTLGGNQSLYSPNARSSHSPPPFGSKHERNSKVPRRSLSAFSSVFDRLAVYRTRLRSAASEVYKRVQAEFDHLSELTVCDNSPIQLEFSLSNVMCCLCLPFYPTLFSCQPSKKGSLFDLSASFGNTATPSTGRRGVSSLSLGEGGSKRSSDDSAGRGRGGPQSVLYGYWVWFLVLVESACNAMCLKALIVKPTQTTRSIGIGRNGLKKQLDEFVAENRSSRKRRKKLLNRALMLGLVVCVYLVDRLGLWGNVGFLISRVQTVCKYYFEMWGLPYTGNTPGAPSSYDDITEDEGNILLEYLYEMVEEEPVSYEGEAGTGKDEFADFSFADALRFLSDNSSSFKELRETMLKRFGVPGEDEVGDEEVPEEEGEESCADDEGSCESPVRKSPYSLESSKPGALDSPSLLEDIKGDTCSNNLAKLGIKMQKDGRWRWKGWVENKELMKQRLKFEKEVMNLDEATKLKFKKLMATLILQQLREEAAEAPVDGSNGCADSNKAAPSARSNPRVEKIKRGNE